MFSLGNVFPGKRCYMLRLFIAELWGRIICQEGMKTYAMCVGHARGRELNNFMDAHHRAGPR